MTEHGQMYSIQWEAVDRTLLRAVGADTVHEAQDRGLPGVGLASVLDAGWTAPGIGGTPPQPHPFGPKSTLLWSFVYLLFHANGMVQGRVGKMVPKDPHVRMLRSETGDRTAYLVVGYGDGPDRLLAPFPEIDERLLERAPGWRFADSRSALHTAIYRVVSVVNTVALAREHLLAERRDPESLWHNPQTP
jgi:hypothetical protein